MDTHPTPQPDPASTDAAVPTPTRIGWIEGHMPEIVEPLDPQHPDTAFTGTRRLRHDGWTPEKKRAFLSRFAECGVVRDACLAVGMSARAAYNLHDRDPLFRAGWSAACVMARPRLADEAYSRSMNGVVERIYKDGVVVAERHRYDNRLTMAVLARLDARVDRDRERGAPHLALVANWDEYLEALGDDRREDGLALLAPAPPAELHESADDRELRELHPAGSAGIEPQREDEHDVWEEEDGWWTDYPPPAGFDGEERGNYGALHYRRSLAPAEQAVIDARVAEEAAQEAAWMAAGLAEAEAQRDAFFAPKPPLRSEPGPWPREQREESGRAGRPAASPTGSTGSGRPDPDAEPSAKPRSSEAVSSPAGPIAAAPRSGCSPCYGVAYMAETNHDIRTLNGLIATTLDSVDGYTEAAKDTEDTRFNTLFRNRAAERRQVADSLQAEVARLGGNPEDDGTLLAGAHRAFLNLKAAVTGQDDKAIVNEVERGEDHIKAKFEDAMQDGDLSPATKSAIGAAWGSVKAGHDEMRDLKHSMER